MLGLSCFTGFAILFSSLGWTQVVFLYMFYRFIQQFRLGCRLFSSFVHQLRLGVGCFTGFTGSFGSLDQVFFYMVYRLRLTGFIILFVHKFKLGYFFCRRYRSFRQLCQVQVVLQVFSFLISSLTQVQVFFYRFCGFVHWFRLRLGIFTCFTSLFISFG